MPRKFKRFHVSLDIVIDFTSGKREARVTDLSMGGCFVDSILMVIQGEKIVFRLRIPTGELLKLSGEIAYSLPRFGFGIQFDDLSEEQRFLLEQTILVYGGDPYDESD